MLSLKRKGYIFKNCDATLMFKNNIDHTSEIQSLKLTSIVGKGQKSDSY